VAFSVVNAATANLPISVYHPPPCVGRLAVLSFWFAAVFANFQGRKDYSVEETIRIYGVFRSVGKHRSGSRVAQAPPMGREFGG
jgi:hypothetical protein